MSIAATIIFIIIFVMSVVIHEVSHGLVAYRLGDDTAYLKGRLTLNPIPHIDPVMTILVPAVLFFSAGFLFGAAKGVPINPLRFRKPRYGMMLTAMAGPASNILIAIVLAIVLIPSSYLRASNGIATPSFVEIALARGVFINVLLAGFNMIPIPPLDGSRLLAWLVPREWSYKIDQIERYGFFILIGVIYLRLHVPVLRVFMIAAKFLLMPAEIISNNTLLQHFLAT